MERVFVIILRSVFPIIDESVPLSIFLSEPLISKHSIAVKLHIIIQRMSSSVLNL